MFYATTKQDIFKLNNQFLRVCRCGTQEYMYENNSLYAPNSGVSVNHLQCLIEGQSLIVYMNGSNQTVIHAYEYCIDDIDDYIKDQTQCVIDFKKSHNHINENQQLTTVFSKQEKVDIILKEQLIKIINNQTMFKDQQYKIFKLPIAKQQKILQLQFCLKSSKQGSDEIYLFDLFYITVIDTSKYQQFLMTKVTDKIFVKCNQLFMYDCSIILILLQNRFSYLIISNDDLKMYLNDQCNTQQVLDKFYIDIQVYKQKVLNNKKLRQLKYNLLQSKYGKSNQLQFNYEMQQLSRYDTFKNCVIIFSIKQEQYLVEYGQNKQFDFLIVVQFDNLTNYISYIANSTLSKISFDSLEKLHQKIPKYLLSEEEFQLMLLFNDTTSLNSYQEQQFNQIQQQLKFVQNSRQISTAVESVKQMNNYKQNLPEQVSQIQPLQKETKQKLTKQQLDSESDDIGNIFKCVPKTQVPLKQDQNIKNKMQQFHSQKTQQQSKSVIGSLTQELLSDPVSPYNQEIKASIQKQTFQSNEDSDSINPFKTDKQVNNQLVEDKQNLQSNLTQLPVMTQNLSSIKIDTQQTPQKQSVFDQVLDISEETISAKENSSHAQVNANQNLICVEYQDIQYQLDKHKSQIQLNFLSNQGQLKINNEFILDVNFQNKPQSYCQMEYIDWKELL